MPTAVVIDSQTVRAADTVPTASSGYDGGNKIKGRKRHVAVDTGGLLLAVVVTTASLPGPRRWVPHHRRAARGVLHDHLVWVDAGYAGRFVRDARKIWELPWRSSSAPTRPRASSCSSAAGSLERSFAWLAKFRRRVRDYETLPATPKP